MAMQGSMVIFLADNKSFIERLQQHHEYILPYPNHTLKAEYDLTEQIFKAILVMKIDATFKHIKGHQDDHKKYNRLSFEAQLTV